MGRRNRPLLKSGNTWGYVVAVWSAIGFATLGIFVKYGYQHGLTTETMLTWRMLGAGVLFGAWSLMTRQRWPLGRDLVVLGVMGAVFYSVMSWLFFSANRLAPIGEVSAVLYLYPVVVTAFSMWFGWERFSRMRMVALTGTFSGVLVVVLKGSSALKFGHQDMIGLIWAAVAALSYSGYIVISSQVLQRVSATVASTIVAFSSAASSAMIGWRTHQLHGVHFSDLWIIAGLVALATVVAVAGFLWSIARLGAGKASIVSTVEPVVAVFLGWALFGQHMTLWQLMGVGVVVVSTIILRWDPEFPVAPSVINELSSQDIVS